MSHDQALVAEVAGVCGGRATIIGRRIEVRHVLGWLSSGATVEEITADYDVTVEQVRACLTWTYDLVERHYGTAGVEPIGKVVSVRTVERHTPH